MYLTHPETGENLDIQDWAKRLGISPNTIKHRLRYKKDLIDVLSEHKQKVLITHPGTGETLCLSDWAKKLGCSRNLLSNRKAQGLSDAEILRPPYKTKVQLEDINTGEKISLEKASKILFFNASSLRRKAKKNDLITDKYRVIRLDAV